MILAALHDMTHTIPSAELGHVRVIAGVRAGQDIDTGAALAHAHRIEIDAPTMADIAAAATASGVALSAEDLSRMVGESITGGWLTARLVGDIADSAGALEVIGDLAKLVTTSAQLGAADDQAALAMLSLIAAAGVGPVLPIGLLATAVASGEASALSWIRNAAVRFGALISRGNPGTDQETLGIGHLAFLHPVTVYLADNGYPLTWAHRALVSAVHGRPDPNEPVGAKSLPKETAFYWLAAGPRHYLESERPELAVKYLEALDTERAAENRDRWVTWLPTVTTALGSDHPATFTARHNLAYWRGRAGDPLGAISDFDALLTDRLRVLGADHLDTLTNRNDLANSRGQAGEVHRAIAEFEALVTDQEHALSRDHHATLTTRHNLAYWRGEAGDVPGAIRECEALLPILVRVLGPDHSDTLVLRGNLADWRGQDGDVSQAIADLKALLEDRLRLGSPDNVDTLITRGNLAYWRGQDGDVSQAIADLKALLEDRLRVLGPDHPDTLLARRHLGDLRGQDGDVPRAIADLEGLLADMVRIHGADHSDTLKAEAALAHWRSESR